MGFFGRLFGSADHEKRKEHILAREAQAASPEALERRTQSVDFLQGKGVPINANLPVIEDLQSAKFRSPREIAERLVACTIAAVGGETGDTVLVRRILNDFSADSLLTPEEHKFLNRQLDDQQQRTQFSWRYERSWVLMWALGYIERLEYPPAICDVPHLAAFLQGKTVDQLVAGAKPRSKVEQLDEADLIYRLNWAVVDERINGTSKVPAAVEKGVVQERHAALNWLIGYQDQEWDDITTDT